LAQRSGEREAKEASLLCTRKNKRKNPGALTHGKRNKEKGREGSRALREGLKKNFKVGKPGKGGGFFWGVAKVKNVSCRRQGILENRAFHAKSTKNGQKQGRKGTGTGMGEDYARIRKGWVVEGENQLGVGRREGTLQTGKDRADTVDGRLANVVNADDRMPCQRGLPLTSVKKTTNSLESGRGGGRVGVPQLNRNSQAPLKFNGVL